MAHAIDADPILVPEAPPCRGAPGMKALLVLFVCFIVVVSDLFVERVVRGIGGPAAVRGRDPSAWGVALQATALVILFSVGMVLADRGML
jgi:hypothetical protein